VSVLVARGTVALPGRKSSTLVHTKDMSVRRSVRALHHQQAGLDPFTQRLRNSRHRKRRQIESVIDLAFDLNVDTDSLKALKSGNSSASI